MTSTIHYSKIHLLKLKTARNELSNERQCILKIDEANHFCLQRISRHFFFFWLPSILFVSWDKIVYISFWLERPKIATFTFGDAPLKFGESASVQCTISGGDLPMTVQWMLNGIEIPPHLEATTAKIGKRIHVLSIESVKADHRGNYSCVATKSSWNGCVYSTAYCYRFVLWLNHSLPFSQCFWNFACCLLFIFSLESVRMIRNLCQLEMENVSIQWFLKL